jgi:hypothetical protein
VRVCFDVHGSNEKALFDQAKKVLGEFSEGRRWSIDIEAHQEMVTADGDVVTWRGEVTASHEDLET